MQEAHRDEPGLPGTDTGHEQLIFLGCMVEVALPGECLTIEVASSPQVNIVFAALQDLFIERRHMEGGGFFVFTGHKKAFYDEQESEDILFLVVYDEG